MNESRNHILDQLSADHKSDEIYRSLDDKIIKSHCETKKAIDNVINNNDPPRILESPQPY